MKSHTRLIASLVMIATIANATGCSKKDNNSYTEYNTDVIATYENEWENTDVLEVSNGLVLDNQEIFLTPAVNMPEDTLNTEESSINIEDLLRETLYDENIDYKSVIDKYLNIDYEQRSEYKNEYLRALYMLMVNSNVPLSYYLTEMNTLLVLQQHPSCLPENLWYEYFGNLISLLGEYPSLHEMFIDLSMYVHELECEYKHNIDEYGSYSCDELKDEYKLM